MEKGQLCMAGEIVSMIREETNFASAYNELADQARRRGFWQRALDLCGESLALCSEPDIATQHCRGVAHLFHGAVNHSMGDIEHAERLYTQAQHYFEVGSESVDRWNEGVAKYARGLTLLCKDDLNAAMRWFRASYSVFMALIAEEPDAKSPLRVVQNRIIQVENLKARRRHRSKPDGVPVIGYTSAGEPKQAITVFPEDMISEGLVIAGRRCRLRPVPPSDTIRDDLFSKGSDYFALVVDGTSMQDVGINDKDYAVFRSQSDVDSGEIAVILLDSGMDADSTVKRLIKRDGKVILRAENPTFHPQEQIFTKNDPTIRVLGKAIAAASFCQE